MGHILTGQMLLLFFVLILRAQRNNGKSGVGCVLKVKTLVTICKNCGWQSLDIGQVDELLKRTTNIYCELRDEF